LTRRVCNGEPGSLQFRIVGLKGTERWLETTAVPFFDERRGKTVLLGVTRDITESKRYQEELERTIAEKEMLMRETYHRVKNNLSVLQSLLRLQHKEVSDKMAREKLRETEDRVRSMSLIHEQLSRSANLKNIDLTEYLRSLISKLSASYKAEESGITVNLDCPPLDIDVNLIIPIGLIINELVTNAFKYAFPDGDGEIGIAVAEDDESYSIRITDNGVGMPEGLDIYRTSSLGLQIVTSLVTQLKAALTLETDGGTIFTLKISKQQH
jgi:two-component sensor histidine kinase